MSKSERVPRPFMTTTMARLPDATRFDKAEARRPSTESNHTWRPPKRLPPLCIPTLRAHPIRWRLPQHSEAEGGGGGGRLGGPQE